jgi:hypothetical protein
MNNKTDKKSIPETNRPRAEKIFFIILGLLIFGSVTVTYYRIMIQKNYIIEAQADCDPYVQKCFVWQCDPASDVDGEKCTGDAEADIWYYELVERNASKIPLCDPNDENCKALECEDGELECQYIFCDDKTKLAQEVECSDPVEYAKNNPPEEEEDEGEEDDASSEEATCPEGDSSCEAGAADECEPDDVECQAGVGQDDATSADAVPVE